MRILIGDDHELLRCGLRSLFETQTGWQVVGEAKDGLEAVELAKKLEPNVVILDYRMPVLSGTEAARQIASASPTIGVVIFSMYQTDEVLKSVVASGAKGYVQKSERHEELLEAVRIVGQGRCSYPESLNSVTLEHAPLLLLKDEGVRKISPRERAVLYRIGLGLTVREIAAVLKISPRTVEVHRNNLMNKLQLHSVRDLVLYAVRQGMVDSWTVDSDRGSGLVLDPKMQGDML